MRSDRPREETTGKTALAGSAGLREQQLWLTIHSEPERQHGSRPTVRVTQERDGEQNGERDGV